MKRLAPPEPHPYTQRAPREFDTSSLRDAGHGRYVHRDYAAHWFRWQHALRFVRADMRVLDIGCGPDQMMTKVLCASQSHVPELYVGVDVQKLPRKSGIAWTRIFDEFDVTRRWRELLGGLYATPRTSSLGPFDVISCFEVIEHMPRDRGRRLLEAIRHLLKADGIALLSTPVYNERHMAANHIHEYRFEELEQEITRAGLVVDRVVGTFMTAAAAKRVATPAQRLLLEELHDKWYAWDILANFLAPLYPRASSNCCWILKRKA